MSILVYHDQHYVEYNENYYIFISHAAGFYLFA